MTSMIRLSGRLAVGAALGFVLGCGSSTPKANGVAGTQGSSASIPSGGGSDSAGGSGTETVVRWPCAYMDIFKSNIVWQ